MSLDSLVDPGVVVALLGVLARFGGGLLKRLLAEVTGLRSDLAAHVAQDEERHTRVVAALQQRWAAQKPS